MDYRKIVSSKNFKIVLGYFTFLGVLFAAAPLLSRVSRPFIDAFHVKFIADFRVINQTAEPLYVTPVALWDQRERGFLPQYSSKMPPLHDVEQRENVIGPGETKQIFYDQDDACLSELVIRNGRGELKELVVPVEVSGCDLVHPKSPTIAIERLANLPPVSAEVQKVLARPPSKPMHQTLFGIVLGISALLLPLAMLMIPNRKSGTKNK